MGVGLSRVADAAVAVVDVSAVVIELVHPTIAAHIWL